MARHGSVSSEFISCLPSGDLATLLRIEDDAVLRKQRPEIMAPSCGPHPLGIKSIVSKDHSWPQARPDDPLQPLEHCPSSSMYFQPLLLFIRAILLYALLPENTDRLPSNGDVRADFSAVPESWPVLGEALSALPQQQWLMMEAPFLSNSPPRRRSHYPLSSTEAKKSSAVHLLIEDAAGWTRVTGVRTCYDSFCGAATGVRLF
ncbi:hypothetical protein K488DRAFT_72322 [Vararia minispora EC-137]|uniref:Uncharacterized protein n=1 Tax=Vararia minispora EC-137 TaxID=1314806 RepID=A0ACB8QF91_9AGAM|nr:hypothetical protein K488DRAFT_72322 [Vararia minispora EC-137]